MYNVHVDPRPSGNSKQRAHRRLREQRPDLHARVLSGELSAHKAMLAAGFREPTVSIPREPAAAAVAMLRRFGEEWAIALLHELTERKNAL